MRRTDVDACDDDQPGTLDGVEQVADVAAAAGIHGGLVAIVPCMVPAL